MLQALSILSYDDRCSVFGSLEAVQLRNGKHQIKSVFSGRPKCRVGLRTHHFRSEGFRHSPRHTRRSVHPRTTEDMSASVNVPESNQLSSSSQLRKRRVKKRVQPEFYQSVQLTPTHKASTSSGNPSQRCSMSSSADLSDEDEYSVKSGSASPAPGDTLPWNLPRHERSKRKTLSSILDPAERAVLRIAVGLVRVMAQYAPQGCTFSEEQEYLQAYEDVLEKYKDERDRVQKKTFTKWINQHLMKVRKHINDLYEDLRDGHNLISLLEVLSGDTLPRERGRMRFHKLQNVQIALDYLKRRQVKLVNIRNDDITDGNPKLTLGLIWTIILHFQISEIHVTGESEDMTAKERLLFWSKQMTEGYVGVRCDNFTTSWRDGKLFNAIIHKYRPDLVDMSHISAQTNRSNLEQAFCVAEQLGVARLLDPEDVDVQSPDEKSVITYVSTLYDAFPKVPDGVDGISPNDVDIKWVEYQNMIKYLSQWIKHNVAIMNDRAFPNSPAELKALYSQYLQFKDYEIPIKEIEKTKIQNLYQMLEVWIEFGRIQLPPGHHPNDMEKEWGKLIVAMLEREKSLRPELERLEMLQQIANRIQRDCVNGEERLSLAKASLQSDTKRLESGIQVLNEAEVASNLLECENILRQQVVDIQILLDGKFPFADQLVQRISKLRDDLLVLRAECLSVYSRGHTLTSEQAKMMISGITQSLNSGFSPNMSSSSLSAGLSAGGMVTPGSAYTSSLSPCLSPAHPPVMSPGLQSSMQTFMSGGGGSLDADGFRHVKQMQIRKPLMKSSLADPTMSEDEVNMKYVQDLLTWVEEMQLQLDRAEWGSDLPSVETSLDNHRSIHRAIEDFQTSLKEAKLGEIQMTSQTKLNYSEKLNRLDKQYDRLLSSSRDRQSHLENLHDFVSKATQELIWLNEKEEEEVAFDWSDRNSNISKKRDYHADLMRELDDKDDAIKSVQDKADRLLLKNHPARLTIEAYRAAMQTQWSWILQLCACVEQHLKENAVYFEFFSDAKESMDYLKSLQDTIHRKYSCDRTSSLHRLDDLIQESMDEKEQLLQYRSTVAGLVGRAKSIVQLRPRNPDNPVRSSIPVKAICDYRQIEITIYKEDECVLASNSHRAKWKVINPAGNEAMVPSVCFTVPPPNKEAVDMATKTEQLYQNVLSLWHHSHINMSSVVAWHRLMADIRAIHNWNVSSIKTMLPGEHQQVIHNLQVHFDEFLKDSKESEVFTVADCAQLDRDVAVCKEYYEELLRSAEREEHQESAYNHYISDIRNFRMHLESHEEHLIRQIRTPLERDDLDQSLLRITEHEKKIVELSKLKEDFDVMKDKCEVFIRQAVGSTSASTLSSELTALGHSMNQVHSMAFIYLDKLKTVSLVVKHSQSAEMLIKSYESKLYEEDAMNSDLKSIEAVVTTLKQWRTEIDEQQEVFHDMEDELQKARVIGDRMFKAHNERDFDLDWHKEKADQLSERWQSVHSQIDSRLRDLDGINKSLKHYKESYGSLDEWIQEMEATQLKAQENKPEDSKALAELLNKQKVLVGEIEQIQGRIDECQKYSEQYSTSVKDYELQLMTFRAVVDSQHKSPLKKRRMQSSADAIQQEFMDLRTRYTALVTLMTQYVKFASETLKRTEEEETRKNIEKAESAKWTESLELQKVAGETEVNQLMQRIHGQEALLGTKQAELEEMEGEIEKLQQTISGVNQDKSKLEHEVNQYRTKLKMALKEKDAIHQELQHTLQLIEQLETERARAEEERRQQESRQQQSRQQEESVQEVKVQTTDNSLAPAEAVLLQSEVHTAAMKDNEVLQQKLIMSQSKAEVAEKKAEAFKKLLDDSNEALQKLQMEIETERISINKKSEDLHLQTINLKKVIGELQEEIRSLQRAKSSLEQNVFFQQTEMEGLKEQLKITQGELQKKTSMDQDKSIKMQELEEELDSKQAANNQASALKTAVIQENVTDSNQVTKASAAVDAMIKTKVSAEVANTKSRQTPEEPKHLTSQTVISKTTQYEEPAQNMNNQGNATTKRQYITKVFEITENVTTHSESGLSTRKDVQTTSTHFGGKSTTIAGVYVESSKKKMSFLEAAEKGFLAKTYARSVDEEKREHGDKVSKLLHWMSNVKHSINQDGSVTDSNANTGSSKRPQVSMEDLVTKKEQIAEAMRITEAKLNKHSEKMTDEEREEAKEQLKELNQAYSDLSQHCESNTSSADEEVMDTLNSALGGETAPVTRHRLDSIKEEEEAEGDLDLPVEDSTVSGKDKDTSKIKEVQNMLFSIQDYLECVGKLQDHADVLEDIQKDLCCPTPGNMEELQSQMVECQTLKTQLSELAEVLTVDMKKAKQLLNSAAVEIPKQIHQDLASTYLDLEPQFIAVCKMCAERSNSLNDAIQAGKGHLESAFVQHVNTLQELADCCKCDSEASAMDLNVCDINRLIFLIQQNKDLENSLRKNGRQKLEDVTFDIQSFLSEHAQFLSPAHSSCLLKLLSSTQRAFKEQTERLAAERSSMELLVEQKQMQNQAQTILEKHKEFSEKLEELFDDLTLTENRLIGHQQQAENTESLSELQQYQQEHQALQKDVMTNASALNEVVSSTKKYLEENRSKLSPAQVAEIENKLEDATSKSKVINQRVEDSRKDLEKVVTSAIKQESEKAAAVERLEESKNKIEGLLDWISNIGHDNKSSPDETDHMSNTNGNPPGEISAKELMDEDANGNAPRSPGQDHSRENGQSSASADLDKQYAKVKAHHQNILSQQQDLLIATQSAQTLLDKQANVLSPEEKERLQKNIHELKGRYETSLTQAEQQMKQLQCVQEELKTFQDDCQEFEGWLDQAEDEMQKLETPAGSLNILTDKLLYQRNFSEDVISHKGDLRFITISGQKVLDVAQACGVANAADKNTHVPLDTSGASALVKNKLDSAATRYKALHSQCNQLGNNIKDVIDKYKKYNDSTAGLLKWLNNSEDEARKQQSEAIAADPQTLQKQLEDNKVLQNQTTGHQAAVDTLSKTAESLISSEGDLLSNTDEIQETVDDIVERYDNLSKSVSDRNEKIQITLTRSMSVQDGLDEMLGWMQRVEASVKEDIQVPLDSVSMASALSKENALEQDMASRQGSISAIKAKVKKFAETADPSAAAQLQFNMEALSQRFSNACDQQKQKVSTLEQLKKKVEDFEKVSEKVQQFVMRRSQELHETDGPSKTFTELSGLMQNTKAEMEEHARDLEKLQSLSKELCELSTDGNKIQIQSKMENLTNTFNSFKDTVQEKEEEVSSCRDQLEEFRALSSSLTSWLEQTKDKVPAVDPSRSEKCLEKDLQIVTGLMDEWTSKTPIVQDMNSKGSTLCSFITFLTSPAKSKNSNKAALTNGGGPVNHSYLTNKDLMVIQQKMSFVNEEYKNLGDSLKSRAADIGNLVHEVKRAQKETADMMAWLKDMKKTAASWKVAATENDSVKTQLENQKIVEDNMKQKTEEMQELREKLLHLIQTHPNTPEAAKWKQMLSEIDAAWADISDSVVERKQHLEQSNKNLDIFKTSEQQLCQWLSEKEMLMSVLGPLSIDPNMLKMQKQQVQIIQNEFKSRAPQYEQLQKAASALLSSTQEPQNGKIVEAQLAVVTQKWQNLSGQLDSRDSLIDQAVVKTRQFQQLLTKLSDTTTELEKQITNQHSQSTLPDAVKKHLEVVQKICTQLREEKKKVKEAEDLCSELKALVTEDYLRADLTRQLEAVTKPFSQLEEKAAKCVDELSSTFASSQQFHQTSKDFQLWLSKKLLKESKFISAKVEVLQQTLEDQNKQQQTFAEHERDYVTILAEGERLLQSVDGAEKLALQGLLTKMSRDWEDVKNNHTEQTEKLQTALQKSLKFHENTDKLNSWIQETENREASVKLSVDPVEVENSISQVKALQKDVEKHRGLVEQLNTAAEGLMEVANADTELIKEEKSSIDKRVESVVEALQNRKDTLEQISHKVKEFNDDCKEAQSHLEAAKKQMETYESQGVQAHSNKNLANMKAQHKSLNGVENQIDHLKSLAKDLVVAIPDVDGVTDLLLQSDSIEKEYCTLNKKLEETCQVLEGKLQGIGQFQNNIREMFTRFTDLDDELDNMAPVDLDLDKLKDQETSVVGFISRLQELMSHTSDAGESCKKMLETEDSSDLIGLKRDLETLSKQCGKLLDRAKSRNTQVQNTLQNLEVLYEKVKEVESKLDKAVAKDTSQDPVGMDPGWINQQLESFKTFQKEDIDPLHKQLQEINSLGQSLAQSATKGTCTKKLEGDLEDVNTKWNTLNKKIAERSAQLHESLLHCGRFQDALESLLSWLTDTEELVANQKSPSAEFKVVKAQIQEQKLLQRLLDDRKPTVELIKKEGGKLSELTEAAEKEKVAKEIECLGQRWDSLLKKAENRKKQLESILVVTQQFHEMLEPLSEWLCTTEKVLSHSDPIGTETCKLKEQISQHKTLEEEIMKHSKDLFQAVNLGQMLRTVCSIEDKEFVQNKLDTAQSGYIELQERCRRKAELLQQALSNAQLFGEDEVALMNWLSEVHATLSEVSVEDYRTDTLEKQLKDQWTLQSDIELRKKDVDRTIFSGMELLKQTTGDEVVVIQSKLDGIKNKYTEINTMSDNVLKTLEKVLGLSTQLHQTHEDLNNWLETVEAEVNAFAVNDAAGVNGQLVDIQNRKKDLLQVTKNHKPVVDKLNELSGSLLDLIPWHTRESLDKLVTEDNDRFKSVYENINQQVDQINSDILQSQQFEQLADTELAWLTEAERKLLCVDEIKLTQDQTTSQLQAQKMFSMDIMRHKDTVDGIVRTGKAVMNNRNPEGKETIQAKTQALLEKYGTVSQMNSERCLQLERAQSLAAQFWETFDEMWPWLQETLKVFTQLSPPAIEYEALKQQQEELRQMRELIAEHKPHIDKMNKTGPQMLELSPGEGVPIQEKYTTADQLYTQLKADVKQRAATLDEAISKSTQFHDKIDPMLESLERIAERLRQPPSISVEVDKIKEQIAENKSVSVDLEKLQPSYDTLKQRGEEMVARSEGADTFTSAKVVQDKLDKMVFLWSDIQALVEEREAKLLDVMDLADKFWCDHCALIVTIKDSQDLLKELEEPGVDPSVVKQQQEFVDGFKEEIDGLMEELEAVQNQGADLMAACGEPDKPVIKKSLDEVASAWETLNKTWRERGDRLEEAMQAAVQFQDGLQGMFDWVDILESKLDSMSPVGTDLETVKQQIVEHKEFKGEAYQLQIEMERLNHQAGLLLKKATEDADRCAIQEPMSELKMLWENFEEKIISRQHKLEAGLLALGQFQHALDELLAWMSHTEELLNEQRKTGGDPKAMEIELAKHHVLQIDVLAHQTTVETVNKAGYDLVASSAGEEASSLQNKLESLNLRWKVILEKTDQRKQQLQSALLQAQGFHGEIEDMQQWLKDTERQLLASKAVGGLPDTAREQLNAHLELCSAFGAKEDLYQELIHKGQQLLSVTPEGTDSNTEHDLANLTEKWETVRAKITDRKVKLEEALTLATDFHNSLQDFINWLTQGEQTLNMISPASLIIETIMFQIDEHKMFITEVNAHREHIIELDKNGTQLKYFSQKQDVVLIKNLLISVQSRWEKLVQRSVERGRLLDDAKKRAKQFHESWNKLMQWLDESERSLDSEVEIANEPDKIKIQLTQHKEYQKALGSKHSVYDTTSRTGRALKDKTSLRDDKQKLDDMLSELRDKWDTVCGKSIERQNKLEEALLFSGQFKDALQALIDWLYRVEPQLAEDQPVHGDIDLVLNLIDNHKVFQKEMGKRTVGVQALKRSARELMESSHDDTSWVKVQMQELSTRWDSVCSLSVSKQARLEQALCQAEEFHSSVHILLEWLAEAEQSLRFHGSLPDDEDALRALIEQHKDFMKRLEDKRVSLNKATAMGEAILSICHPDSITTVKHWNTIIKARFEEVQAWSRQYQQRLTTALNELLATMDLLDKLLMWLQWAETNLCDKDKEILPEEIEDIKHLIAEHQSFMEEMTRKQPDVDIITKTHKRKATMEPHVQSQIPVLERGRTGRKRSPTQTMYTSATQAHIETKNPQVNLLVSKWQHVWLLALDRRRKLNDALDRLEELKEFANFDFDVWRKSYMRWMNHKKSRVMDFFRRMDKDQDGKVTRQEFIEGIVSSKFPTSRLEMSAVADIFDRDGDGYIDYYEFVAALHPNKEAYKPLTDADKIEDEVTRQVAKCKCPKRFQVEQIGANKYRFYLGNQFGDSQQLRLVRILRSTVMVRVGGGWMALDEFLVKNDPCRVHHHGSKMLRSESNSSITQSPIGWQISNFLLLRHEPTCAKGRTNIELREKFILPEGTTQVMASFRYRGRRSRPSSRGASPNRSMSSQSCPAHQPMPVTGTPKTPQQITRNYDKPWLTNSKPSTPLKSSDSPGSSPAESTPVQGSKLRLPGYLSGKGFQSGEEGTLINAAVLKARAQTAGESKKNLSRPGSKAGSRGSSRRGSDASDFDISDIQSVCSDASELVGDSGFDFLEEFRVSESRGVRRVDGSKPEVVAYRINPSIHLRKTTSELYPDGLPADYSVIATFKVPKDTAKQSWSLWQVSDSKGRDQVGLRFHPGMRSLDFFYTSSHGSQMLRTFSGVERLFDGAWHKLALSVKGGQAKLLIDCEEVSVKPIDEDRPVIRRGYTSIAKRAAEDRSVSVDFQQMEVSCDPEKAYTEGCCELGEEGIKGEKGMRGLWGQVGDRGPKGLKGLKGAAGFKGVRGPPGVIGETGKQGEVGVKGVKGFDGIPGYQGVKGEKGTMGVVGKPGPRGKQVGIPCDKALWEILATQGLLDSRASLESKGLLADVEEWDRRALLEIQDYQEEMEILVSRVKKASKVHKERWVPKAKLSEIVVRWDLRGSGESVVQRAHSDRLALEE
uniref:Dystonin n=1 Tax=Knipowitschia caucasica TaxID=637954 RepID=A0AAV2JR41_KNICA